MNKTKIIATIGPSTKDKEIIKQLIKSGMDVARINLEHSDYDFCTDIVNKINEVNEELDKIDIKSIIEDQVRRVVNVSPKVNDKQIKDFVRERIAKIVTIDITKEL